MIKNTLKGNKFQITDE